MDVVVFILRSSASSNYFESFGFYVNILGGNQIYFYQDKYHMAKRCIFLCPCVIYGCKEFHVVGVAPHFYVSWGNATFDLKPLD